MKLNKISNLDNCLKWEGIIGYTDFIIELVHELYFES